MSEILQSAGGEGAGARSQVGVQLVHSADNGTLANVTLTASMFRKAELGTLLVLAAQTSVSWPLVGRMASEARRSWAPGSARTEEAKSNVLRRVTSAVTASAVLALGSQVGMPGLRATKAGSARVGLDELVPATLGMRLPLRVTANRQGNRDDSSVCVPQLLSGPMFDRLLSAVSGAHVDAAEAAHDAVSRAASQVSLRVGTELTLGDAFGDGSSRMRHDAITLAEARVSVDLTLQDPSTIVAEHFDFWRPASRSAWPAVLSQDGLRGVGPKWDETLWLPVGDQAPPERFVFNVSRADRSYPATATVELLLLNRFCRSPVCWGVELPQVGPSDGKTLAVCAARPECQAGTTLFTAKVHRGSGELTEISNTVFVPDEVRGAQLIGAVLQVQLLSNTSVRFVASAGWPVAHGDASASHRSMAMQAWPMQSEVIDTRLNLVPAQYRLLLLEQAVACIGCGPPPSVLPSLPAAFNGSAVGLVVSEFIWAAPGTSAQALRGVLGASIGPGRPFLLGDSSRSAEAAAMLGPAADRTWPETAALVSRIVNAAAAVFVRSAGSLSLTEPLLLDGGVRECQRTAHHGSPAVDGPVQYQVSHSLGSGSGALVCGRVDVNSSISALSGDDVSMTDTRWSFSAPADQLQTRLVVVANVSVGPDADACIKSLARTLSVPAPVLGRAAATPPQTIGDNSTIVMDSSQPAWTVDDPATTALCLSARGARALTRSDDVPRPDWQVELPGLGSASPFGPVLTPGASWSVQLGLPAALVVFGPAIADAGPRAAGQPGGTPQGSSPMYVFVPRGQGRLRSGVLTAKLAGAVPASWCLGASGRNDPAGVQAPGPGACGAAAPSAAGIAFAVSGVSGGAAGNANAWRGTTAASLAGFVARLLSLETVRGAAAALEAFASGPDPAAPLLGLKGAIGETWGGWAGRTLQTTTLGLEASSDGVPTTGLIAVAVLADVNAALDLLAAGGDRSTLLSADFHGATTVTDWPDVQLVMPEQLRRVVRTYLGLDILVGTLGDVVLQRPAPAPVSLQGVAAAAWAAGGYSSDAGWPGGAGLDAVVGAPPSWCAQPSPGCLRVVGSRPREVIPDSRMPAMLPGRMGADVIVQLITAAPASGPLRHEGALPQCLGRLADSLTGEAAWRLSRWELYWPYTPAVIESWSAVGGRAIEWLPALAFECWTPAVAGLLEGADVAALLPGVDAHAAVQGASLWGAVETVAWMFPSVLGCDEPGACPPPGQRWPWSQWFGDVELRAPREPAWPRPHPRPSQVPLGPLTSVSPSPSASVSPSPLASVSPSPLASVSPSPSASVSPSPSVSVSPSPSASVSPAPFTTPFPTSAPMCQPLAAAPGSGMNASCGGTSPRPVGATCSFECPPGNVTLGTADALAALRADDVAALTAWDAQVTAGVPSGNSGAASSTTSFRVACGAGGAWRAAPSARHGGAGPTAVLQRHVTSLRCAAAQPQPPTKPLVQTCAQVASVELSLPHGVRLPEAATRCGGARGAFRWAPTAGAAGRTVELYAVDASNAPPRLATAVPGLVSVSDLVGSAGASVRLLGRVVTSPRTVWAPEALGVVVIEPVGGGEAFSSVASLGVAAPAAEPADFGGAPGPCGAEPVMPRGHPASVLRLRLRFLDDLIGRRIVLVAATDSGIPGGALVLGPPSEPFTPEPRGCLVLPRLAVVPGTGAGGAAEVASLPVLGASSPEFALRFLLPAPPAATEAVGVRCEASSPARPNGRVLLDHSGAVLTAATWQASPSRELVVVAAMPAAAPAVASTQTVACRFVSTASSPARLAQALSAAPAPAGAGRRSLAGLDALDLPPPDAVYEGVLPQSFAVRVRPVLVPLVAEALVKAAPNSSLWVPVARRGVTPFFLPEGSVPGAAELEAALGGPVRQVAPVTLTSSGALDVILLCSGGSAAPCFRPATRILVGAAEATVLNISADGLAALITLPAQRAACGGVPMADGGGGGGGGSGAFRGAWLDIAAPGAAGECGWQGVTVLPAGRGLLEWSPGPVGAGRRIQPLCPVPPLRLDSIADGDTAALCLAGVEPGLLSGDAAGSILAQAGPAAARGGYTAVGTGSGGGGGAARTRLASGGRTAQPLAVYFTQSCVGFSEPSPECLDAKAVDAGDVVCAFGSGDGCRSCRSLCPDGFSRCALCPGGLRARPREGFWSGGESSPAVERCAPPSDARCPGWNATAHASGCGAGFEGPRCELCSAGFYPAPEIGCEVCPPGTSVQLLMLPLALYAGIAAGLMVIGSALYAVMQCAAPARDRRKALLASARVQAAQLGVSGADLDLQAAADVQRQVLNLGGRVPRWSCNRVVFGKAASQAKQLGLWAVVSVQAIVQVSQTAAPGLPPLVEWSLSLLSVFQLAPSVAVHPQCLRASPFITPAGIMALVLLLNLALAAMASVVALCPVGQTGRPTAVRWLPSAFSVASLTYAVATSTATSVRQCYVRGDGLLVLASNPFVECGTAQQSAASTLGLVTLIAVTAGFPVGTLLYIAARGRAMARLIRERKAVDAPAERKRLHLLAGGTSGPATILAFTENPARKASKAAAKAAKARLVPRFAAPLRSAPAPSDDALAAAPADTASRPGGVGPAPGARGAAGALTCSAACASLDESFSKELDPTLSSCMKREFLPSRAWHVPAGHATIAALGITSQILLGVPRPRLSDVITACAVVTAVCLAMAAIVVVDAPYAEGHAWKRWMRALTLLLVCMTSWLSFAQLAASGAFGDEVLVQSGAAAVGPAAYSTIGLCFALIVALFVAVASALGRGTAVSYTCASAGRRLGIVGARRRGQARPHKAPGGLHAGIQSKGAGAAPGNHGTTGRTARAQLPELRRDSMLAMTNPLNARARTGLMGTDSRGGDPGGPDQPRDLSTADLQARSRTGRTKERVIRQARPSKVRETMDG